MCQNGSSNSKNLNSNSRILRIGSFTHRLMKEEKDTLCSLPWLRNLSLPDAKNLATPVLLWFQYYLYYDPNSGLKKDNLDREKSKYFAFLCSCNFLSLVLHLLPSLIILFKLSMSTLEINFSLFPLCSFKAGYHLCGRNQTCPFGASSAYECIIMLQQTRELRKD